MKRLLLMLLTLAITLTVGAQSAETLYKKGKELYDQKNYTEAVPKLKAAADKGHKKAQYRMGRCYEKGRGVGKDAKEAFKWYEKSAAQDYAKAQYQLAQAYIKGKGVDADEQKARSLLKKALASDKHGKEILDKIKADAAEGDETAQKMLKMTGKK